jgi:hypothetical protein
MSVVAPCTPPFTPTSSPKINKRGFSLAPLQRTLRRRASSGARPGPWDAAPRSGFEGEAVGLCATDLLKFCRRKTRAGLQKIDRVLVEPASHAARTSAATDRSIDPISLIDQICSGMKS